MQFSLYLRTNSPAIEIDGRPISDGPGPMTARIRDLYKALVVAETG